MAQYRLVQNLCCGCTSVFGTPQNVVEYVSIRDDTMVFSNRKTGR